VTVYYVDLNVVGWLLVGMTFGLGMILVLSGRRSS